MREDLVDITIVGAGPVGLMCAYLAKLCGLSVVIIDKAGAPLSVGRADALNARTLQLLEIVGLFDELYVQGKPCNTSSVWQKGQLISRQSTWWDELKGCLHKHFLMLGQAYVERLLNVKLGEMNQPIRRSVTVSDIEISGESCITTLSDNRRIRSNCVIGADGSRSFVRHHFAIPFDIVRPQLIWAVIDAVITTDFPKAPEIISFQAETADVAWIPREGDIDRFYVRMDTKMFSQAEVFEKIQTAMQPYSIQFDSIVWFSQFSVKESVAKRFFVQERVFLVGDACHVHSVNGGQGLNTGIADAFNLIWKIHQVVLGNMSSKLLHDYERERKPVAQTVIESSAKLVRATKYSDSGSHAADYVNLVEQYAGNITGMGIRYPGVGLNGTRLYDIEIFIGDRPMRLYSLLDYARFTLLLFSSQRIKFDVPSSVRVIVITPQSSSQYYWTNSIEYEQQAILVRPDAYIESIVAIDDLDKVRRHISVLYVNQFSRGEAYAKTRRDC